MPPSPDDAVDGRPAPDDKLLVRVLAASTRGRYLLHEPAAEPPYPLLVGFHGYGENAETHLRHLLAIPGADRWLVASVQALHRFYNTRTDEVVASWMTRQDRELAIQDNIRYVADAVADITQDRPVERLVYVGFSQGVAMAFRAAAGAGHPCDGIIALGGDVPPELKAATTVVLPPVLIGRGLDDRWYTAEKLEEDRRWLHSRGVTSEIVVFAGGHEWTDQFRAAAARFLESRGGAARGGA